MIHWPPGFSNHKVKQISTKRKMKKKDYLQSGNKIRLCPHFL
ncbi:hypothetical protein D1BOALGB6SA_247 [Olavius sp. associated proteobacterium Delta 1]|nr:hypothetical protein D1BOALGB6SA_247 [Olavius sp. associated proteobacterium Delta 1]